MGYVTADPYNQPEKLGLKIVGTLDDPNADYSFDYLVVWLHQDGRIFWARDSGCSCPAPFEDYRSLDDLTVLYSWSEFESEVMDHPAESADKTVLLKKIWRLSENKQECFLE